MSNPPTVADLQQASNLTEYIVPGSANFIANPGTVDWSHWGSDYQGPPIKYGMRVRYHVAHLPHRHLPNGMGLMDLSYLYRYRLPAPRLVPPRPKPWQSDLRTLFPVTKYGRWPRDADGQRWMLLRRLNEYWQNGFHPRTPDTLLRWIKESR